VEKEGGKTKAAIIQREADLLFIRNPNDDEKVKELRWVTKEAHKNVYNQGGK